MTNTGSGEFILDPQLSYQIAQEIAFREEAIARATRAGYLPAIEQRGVDWTAVRDWMYRVQDPSFRWLNAEEQRDCQYIIVARNGAVVAGQHRILGGLMGGNPVPRRSVNLMNMELTCREW